jgi:hypothetical protein
LRGKAATLKPHLKQARYCEFALSHISESRCGVPIHPFHPFFFAGTFAPAFRASDSPIAMACLRLVTFFPLRPLLSLPRFMARISLSTLFPAEGEYFRVDFFLPADFFFAVLVAMATPSWV